MRMLDVAEAEAQLDELIDTVGRGEDVMIMRDGIPVARLVPFEQTGLAATGFNSEQRHETPSG